MDFLPEDLIESFEIYGQMQKEHIEALKLDSPDMERMNFERSKNFAELEQKLRNILYQIQNSSFSDETRKDIVEACNARIKKLLDLDSKISKKIEAHKDKLALQMQALKKNKGAISAYGSKSSNNILVKLSG